MQDIKSWHKRFREPKFQLSRSYGLGCRRGTNFAFNGNGNVTDGKKFIAQIMFLEHIFKKSDAQVGRV
jgi:hypothetical protein